jgi:hypothetical protein
MNRKNISEIGWAISSCLFLWLFSLTQNRGISPRPTAGELFDSFVLFSFMIFGGGGCYHFLTEMVSCPLNDQNSHLWLKLSKRMVAMMLILLSTPIVILLLRDNLSASIAWVLSLLYLVTSFGICFWIAIKIKPIFIEIRSNNRLVTDAGSNAAI